MAKGKKRKKKSGGGGGSTRVETVYVAKKSGLGSVVSTAVAVGAGAGVATIADVALEARDVAPRSRGIVEGLGGGAVAYFTRGKTRIAAASAMGTGVVRALLGSPKRPSESAEPVGVVSAAWQAADAIGRAQLAAQARIRSWVGGVLGAR